MNDAHPLLPLAGEGRDEGLAAADPKAFVARLRALPREKRRVALEAVGEIAAKALDEDWPSWAHAGQEPPHDDWDLWVMLAGRGFGKTRAGAEWISAQARAHPDAKIALVAATPQEARRVMIEGPAGLFAVARGGAERRDMRWEPSLGRLTFASGAEAYVYSGANGEAARGAGHHFAWCDELAKWKSADTAWDNLMLTMRMGARPRVVVTTTPKPLAIVRRILAQPGGVLTGGATRDNPHLSPAFVKLIEGLHAGTRWGRQELEGKLIEDVAGSLFPRKLIEASRAARPGDLRRIVIGVDPPASAEGTCGIVVCGLGHECATNGEPVGYVLADLSEGGLSPEQWAAKVARAAETWRADRIVAEGNQGGDMVVSLIARAGPRLPVTKVHATVGKARRAEPVAAAFERGEAKFAGAFPELEDELARLVTGGEHEGPSPDRADAMVWALTHLLLEKPRAEPRIRQL